MGFIHEATQTYLGSNIHPFNPMQAYRQRLLALRHRLTAGLPEVGFYSYGRSTAGNAVRIPLAFSPDSFNQNYQQPSRMTTKHIPQQWKTSGLRDHWRHGKTENYRIQPKKPRWLPRTPDVAKQIRSLPLTERLEQAQAAWRVAALNQARSRHGNQALAQKFLENFATSGSSPDTSQIYRHTIDGMAPDSPRGKFKKSPQEPIKRPLLKLKEAALSKQGFKNILPQSTARRADLLIQSTMRLNAT